MSKRNQERRLCGTVLLWEGKIKLWGGHESEEAMHAAQGTTMPKVIKTADEECQHDDLGNFI